MKRGVTPDVIRSAADIPPGSIFVYGANTEGRHGAGAADVARRHFGANYGQVGYWGRSYGIITKRLIGDVAWTLDEIAVQVRSFRWFALSLESSTPIYVTAIGCGLAGFTPELIAPLFRKMPRNVYLPQSFIDIIGDDIP